MFGLGINRLGTSTSRLEGAISGLFKNGEAGVWYDPSDVEASLTWRRNLFEYTESFDNSYWGKTGLSVTANNATAPDGSTTADKVTVGSGGHLHFLGAQISPNAGRYSFSMYLKAGASNYAGLRLVNDSFSNDRYAVIINLSTGSFVSEYVVGSPPFKEYEIANAGNGWYRLTIKLDHYTSALNATLFMDDGNANWDGGTALTAFSGNGTDNFLVWGAQLEQSSTATEYQPIRSTFNNAFKQAFPKHTLYQDSKGIYPVSGLGQSVGLMLDKSQGVAFGSQLVTTPNFDSATGWSTGIGHSITGGQLVYDGTGGQYQKTRTNISITNGKLYKIVVDIASLSGSSINVGLSDSGTSFTNPQNTLHTIGIHTIYQYADAASAKVQIQNNDATQTWAVNSITVEEVKGSHATQSDSTKRPVFARHPERGRVNLFKYTEEFDNGAWTKSGTSTITANAATAPNGTQTADRINNFDDVSGDRVYQTINITNSTLTGSVWVKGEGSNIGKNVQVQAKRVGGTFVGTNVTHTLTDSWVRIDATFTQLSDNTGATLVLISPSTNSAESFLVWGAQMELANEATGYQKVVDDYDITESGYKSVYYLQFDGVNDGMKINNCTATAQGTSAFFGYSSNNAGDSAYKVLLDIEVGRLILASSTNAPNAIGYYDGSWNSISGDGDIKVLSFNLQTNNGVMRENGTVLLNDTGYVEKPLGGIMMIGNHHLAIVSGKEFGGNMYQIVLRSTECNDKEIDQAEEFVAIKTGLKSEVVGLATLDLNFGANTYTARNSNGSVL